MVGRVVANDKSSFILAIIPQALTCHNPHLECHGVTRMFLISFTEYVLKVRPPTAGSSEAQIYEFVFFEDRYWYSLAILHQLLNILRISIDFQISIHISLKNHCTYMEIDETSLENDRGVIPNTFGRLYYGNVDF